MIGCLRGVKPLLLMSFSSPLPRGTIGITRDSIKFLVIKRGDGNVLPWNMGRVHFIDNSVSGLYSIC